MDRHSIEGLGDRRQRAYDLKLSRLSDLVQRERAILAARPGDQRLCADPGQAGAPGSAGRVSGNQRIADRGTMFGHPLRSRWTGAPADEVLTGQVLAWARC